MNTKRTWALAALAALALLAPPTARAVQVSRAWLQYWDTPEYAEEFRQVNVDAAGNAIVGGWSGVLKYAPDGTLLWRVPGFQWPILSDAAGNVYASTWDGASYVLRRLDPADGSVVWSLATDHRIVDLAFDAAGDLLAVTQDVVQVRKISASGTLLWAVAEPAVSYGAGLAADANGNALFTGIGADGYLVAKYAPDGTRLWSTTLPGTLNGLGEQIAADAAGNVFVSTFTDVHKLSPDGAPLASAPVASEYYARIRLDAAGNVIALANLWASGGSVVKLDNDLRPLWTTPLGASRIAMAAATDARGNVYVSGYDSAGTPRIVTWVVNANGALAFEEVAPEVGYGYGDGVAVVPDRGFYAIGYTWYFRSSDYGGVLLRFDVRPDEKAVAVDVKPGTYPNVIQLGAGGQIPVAVLSAPAFDARTVDPATVTLAGAPVARRSNGTFQSSFVDVDGDGDLDLLVKIATSALQLPPGESAAVLLGRTFEGTPVRGSDTVVVR